MKAAGLLIACSILCVGCAASRGRAVPEDTGWLTYSGDYSGKRYSDQASIHAGNVRHLRPEWVRQLDGPGKKFEATPLVRDGVMYLSEGPSRVSALNVVTGRPLWIFDRPLPVGTRTMYSVNRGVALLGTRLYWGTLDAHLIALNATTGHLVWDVEAAENSRGYSITAAPLAIDGRIIVGYSGGEMNLPGFLDAFDPESGRRLWRQPTIPAEGEPARKTWPARSPVSPGGAPTWMTGTYDPVSDLLFWGTGNPGIDFNGRHREG